MTMIAASGCAPVSRPSAELAHARVRRLARGSLIAEMDRAHPVTEFSVYPSNTRARTRPDAPALDAQQDCSDRATLSAFGECLRSFATPYRLADAAIEYFRSFVVDANSSAPPLSTLGETELRAFLKDNGAAVPELLGAADTDPRRARLRTSFSDAELQELALLGERRLKALEVSATRIADALRSRAGWIESLGSQPGSARYRLMLSISRTSGEGILQNLATLGFSRPEELSQIPADRARETALVAWAPAAGRELDKIDLSATNPWDILGAHAAELGIGAIGADDARSTREHYAELRSRDNPKVQTKPFAQDAARVAFIDTGVDFMRYPDLGAELSSGSRDLADGDLNPWLPAEGQLAHGSETLATLLTVTARYAPDILTDRKLSVAMWKTYTLRELLSGAFSRYVTWDNRMAIQAAFLEAGRTADLATDGSGAPQIVSVSMGADIAPYLSRVGTGDRVRQAPWLWIMAAGNSGAPVERESIASCFSDLAPQARDDSKILCVGALRQDRATGELKVAGYTNYGARVEIYAPDSMEGSCPGGTSCSTPVITAAAALVQAREPSLTPAQVKQAILEASPEREVAVDLATSSPGLQVLIRQGAVPAKRRIRVFDPQVSIQAALERAAEIRRR